MSLQFNPTPCKGCGKPIVFEKQADGKWLVSEFDVDEQVRLDVHKCPNYKPKPKESAGGWRGTNKQGQMFEARVSQDLQTTETRNNEIILKMLTEISRKQDQDRQKMEGIATNILEILGLIQDQVIKKQEEFKNLTDEEIKKIADTERIDEEPNTKHDGTDYGF